MRETKTKKILFGLFFIPIFIIGLLATTALSSVSSSSTAYAFDGVDACQNPKEPTFEMSDDGTTITRTTYGSLPTNCNQSTGTMKFAWDKKDFTYSNTTSGCTSTVTIGSVPKSGDSVDATAKISTKSNGKCTSTSSNEVVTTTDQLDNSVLKATDGDPTPSDTTTVTTTCSITGGFGWILCPAINLGAGIADASLKFISNKFLDIKTNLYSTTETDGSTNPTYAAWQGMLAFANIIFVIAFLFIIFAQATGFGISNYGIKKMLPKLVIGVILINLSFFICQVLVDLSNITGYAFNAFFANLLSGQVKADSSFLASGNAFTNIAGGILTAGLGIAIIIGAISFFGPILLVGIVAVLMIFLILIAREALIVLLIVISPIAFAAWLLPNTEKLFKQWWKIFIRMLLLFPIISIMFGVSKMLAGILMSTYSPTADTSQITSSTLAQNLADSKGVSGSGDLMGAIMGAAVLVIPLFAVPFILKGALDVVPVLGNLANRAYRGATNGTRKQTDRHLSPYFQNLDKGKAAGRLNMFGMKRSDAARARRRTFSQVRADHKRNIDKQGKTYDQMGENAYLARSIGGEYETDQDGKIKLDQNGNRILRTGLNARSAIRAHDLTHAHEQEELRAQVLKEREAQVLDESKTGTSTMARLEQDRRTIIQARTAATNQQTADYTERLRKEDDFLNQAAGNVAADGRVLASAFAARDLAEQEEKRVKAVRYLGGNNSESMLLQGYTVGANGQLQYNGKVDRKEIEEQLRSAGAITGSQTINDASATARMEAQLRVSKVLDAGQTMKDLPESTLESLQHVQQYRNTTYGAEAIAINAAEQKVLKAETLQNLVDNAVDANGKPADNLQKAQLVNRLNAQLGSIGGYEDFAYSTVDSEGKIVFGGQKGGTLDAVIGGFIDTKGVPGLTKQMLRDESEIDSYVLDANGENVMVQAVDKNNNPVFDPNTGQPVMQKKTQRVKRQYLAAQIAQDKRASDPDSFNSSLIGTTTENIGFLAKRFSELGYNILDKDGKQIVDPESKQPLAPTADNWNKQLLADREAARKLR